MKDQRTKKIAAMGVFLGVALVASYIESLIPFFFGIPGMKLGLTNVVIILALYLYGPKEALGISVMRILLVSAMFGNAFSAAYSFGGGLISFLVMFLLYRYTKLAIMTVSVAGGISHNMGQLLVAALIVDNTKILYYLPVLFIAGAVTGALIGMIAAAVKGRILAAKI